MMVPIVLFFCAEDGSKRIFPVLSVSTSPGQATFYSLVGDRGTDGAGMGGAGGFHHCIGIPMCRHFDFARQCAHLQPRVLDCYHARAVTVLPLIAPTMYAMTTAATKSCCTAVTRDVGSVAFVSVPT